MICETNDFFLDTRGNLAKITGDLKMSSIQRIPHTQCIMLLLTINSIHNLHVGISISPIRENLGYLSNIEGYLCLLDNVFLNNGLEDNNGFDC